MYAVMFRVIVFVFITVECRVFSLDAARIQRSVENGIEPIVVTLEIGEYVRMVYKPIADGFAVSAFKFGIWKKNNLRIKNTTGYIDVGMNKKKKRFWLKIKNVGMQDAGLYSFMINCTVVKQWLLHVKDSSPGSCGRPSGDLITPCMPLFSETSHPNCRSFPGPPLDTKVSSHLYKGLPVIEVTWKPPYVGFRDLWGYQLYIIGKDNHPGHLTCFQINRETERLYWYFITNIRYGATYRIFVRSMPSRQNSDENSAFLDVKVPEKCQFEEHANLSECCSIINITEKYTDKAIHLKWAVPLQEHCQKIKKFVVNWFNIQKPAECHGRTSIKGRYEYIIHFKKEQCNRFNYSIKLSGEINKKETKVFKKTVSIPPQATSTTGPK